MQHSIINGGDEGPCDDEKAAPPYVLSGHQTETSEVGLFDGS